jgi:hypothetical protein
MNDAYRSVKLTQTKHCPFAPRVIVTFSEMYHALQQIRKPTNRY